MSYEILSDDVKASSSKSSKDKKKKGKKKPNINMMYVHVGVIIVIVILLLIYLFSAIDFSFKDSKNKEDLLTLVGVLHSFDEVYQGNMVVSATEFVLVTPIGEFNDRSKDIVIDNFSGKIYFVNRTIVISGNAESVEYAKNKINLKGQEFVLNSTKKTTMDLYFDDIKLDYKEGRIKLNSDLNFEFDNSTMFIEQFNFTFGYDGVFSFQGTSDNFSLMTHNPDLTISYANE